MIRLPKRLLAPLALLLCLPAAHAAPTPLPPMGLHATPGPDGTVELSWSPPLGAASDLAYAVYANGLPVGVVDEPRFQVAEGDPVLYAVTALADGAESLPADLLVAHLHVAPGWPVDPQGLPPRCPPLGTDIYTHYPFVGVDVYEECLGPWPPQP